MTKKELQEYYWIDKNIENLEEKLLELESQAVKITSRISNEPRGTSKNTDRMAGIVAEIIEVKNTIEVELKKAYYLLNKIEKSIDALPPKEKYLMRKRYIECCNWEEICVDMSYSEQHIHRLHCKALKLLA